MENSFRLEYTIMSCRIENSLSNMHIYHFNTSSYFLHAFKSTVIRIYKLLIFTYCMTAKFLNGKLTDVEMSNEI